MHWKSGYIAVDWGTTNRRAYRVGADSAAACFEDDQGVMAVPPGGFAEAVAEIRERLGDLPMLLAGMIGSNRGWHEAPYVACAAGVREIADQVQWIDQRTGIVPGVCQRQPNPDVMRGEEVQAVGAVAGGLIPEDALICHPGTHAKWIAMKSGRIESFRTMMTGEVFALLSKHSILADQMREPATGGAEFAAGVRESLGGEPFLSALFRIRARRLLGDASGDAASRASGILIGSEVASARAEFGDRQVALIGKPELCQLYATAIAMAGGECCVIDGADAFLAGMSSLTRAFE